MPNIITFSNAIQSCGSQSQWQVSLQLLSGMEEEEVLPDQICFSTVIQTSEWMYGLALLEAMQIRMLQPDRVSYNSALKSLAKVPLSRLTLK